MRWWWIFLGGGLGSVCRVAVGTWITARAGAGWPWGTFAVNVAGCVAIGAVAAWLDTRGGDHPSHPFLVAGFLGGFTTFSTFGLETLRLLEAARPTAAAGYAAASLVLGVVGVLLGFWMVRATATG